MSTDTGGKYRRVEFTGPEIDMSKANTIDEIKDKLGNLREYIAELESELSKAKYCLLELNLRLAYQTRELTQSIEGDKG